MLPLQDRFQAILARHATVLDALNHAPDSSTLVGLSRELSDLEPVVDAIQRREGAATTLDELETLLADAADDAEMRALAQAERAVAQAAFEEAERAIVLALLPRDSADERGVIIEIRAGAGGDEAALFAGDLMRMYQRHADLKSWKIDVLSESEGTMGGYKEVIAEISGRGVFARLKFESGVHRVQRVPQTEASGRIHTSAATVAVLPLAEEVDVTINESDLRIETMRAQGSGGQHVNKTESAVRVTHIPSGIAVLVQEERSQHKNKARALAHLRARLFDVARAEADQARAADRRSQVGSGDRSERIRTYNFPQGRVSDHRINLTLYKLDEMMQGLALDEIIDALTAARQAELMAAEGLN